MTQIKTLKQKIEKLRAEYETAQAPRDSQILQEIRDIEKRIEKLKKEGDKMKNTKHTPGPWFATVNHTANGSSASVHNSEGYSILSNINGLTTENIPENEECEANARLIAAAPELLECMNMLACELAHVEKHGKRSNLYDSICEMYKRTLNKAKGGAK